MLNKDQRQIDNLSNLTSLKVSFMDNVEDEHVHPIFNLPKLTSLKLDLSGYHKITNCCLTRLSDLSHLTCLKLKSIKFDGCDKVLDCCFQLTRLKSFAFNPSGNITPSLVSKVISITNLTALSMVSFGFTNDFLQITKLTNLTSLKFGGYGIENKGLLELANLTSLTFLNLPERNLTEEGKAKFRELTQGRVKLISYRF